MTFSQRDGKLIIADGKLTTDCACCAECCWRVSLYHGCPGPKVTISDGGKEVLLCFQDSGQCGEVACNKAQEDIERCTDATPCERTQAISLSTTFVTKAPGTVTVTVEGLVETVSASFDATSVAVSDSCGSIGSIGISSSDDSEKLGSGSCEMKYVTKSETFPTNAGCVVVLINSTTGDALWHFGMYSKVRLEFSAEVDECKEGMCSEFACGVGRGAISNVKYGDEKSSWYPCWKTGVDGEAPVDECVHLTELACHPEENPNGGGSTDDCGCNEGNCDTVRFYCCPAKKLSIDEGNGTEGSPGTEPVTGSSRDCQQKSWRVCNSEAHGALGSLAPSGSYKTLKACREACPPEGYECVGDVCTASDDPDATYKTLEECEAACFGKFACNETGDCVQTGNANDPYENREDCEQNCVTRWDCANSGECHATPAGQYATEQACVEACQAGGGPQYWCVVRDGVRQCSTTQPTEEEMNFPGIVLGGPYDSSGECLNSCRDFACAPVCGGGVACVPQAGGQFASQQKCLQFCNDDTQGLCTLPPYSDSFSGPLTRREYFEIDSAPRDVCLSFVSVRGQPIKATITYPILDPQTCARTGFRIVAGSWRGYKSCDCPDERPVDIKGPIEGPPKGFIGWRKPRGVTYFWVTIFAPCPGTEVEWSIGCTKGPCAETTEPEPYGACCKPDETCDDDLTEKECRDASGRWLGPCTECGENSCPKKKGACCYQDGSCLRKTRQECELGGGVYQGNGVLCADANCPPPPTVGACCLPEGCVGDMTEAECEQFGGEYLGSNTTCADPDPCLGACCAEECQDGTTQSVCEDLLEGVWQGRDSTCEETVCEYDCGDCVRGFQYERPSMYFHNVYTVSPTTAFRTLSHTNRLYGNEESVFGGVLAGGSATPGFEYAYRVWSRCNDPAIQPYLSSPALQAVEVIWYFACGSGRVNWTDTDAGNCTPGPFYRCTCKTRQIRQIWEFRGRTSDNCPQGDATKVHEEVSDTIIRDDGCTCDLVPGFLNFSNITLSTNPLP